MNKEEMEEIVNDIKDALWKLENNKCNIDTIENSWETYYGLNDELIRYIRKIEKENKDLKANRDKAIEILGKYKHYSVPDEKQNSDNEEIVNNAYEILKRRRK